MKKALLNAWPSVIVTPEGEWISQITLELTALPNQIKVERIKPGSTGPGAKHTRPENFEPAHTRDNLCIYRFILYGIQLVMAEDDIVVADGLIKLVRIYAKPHLRAEPQVIVDVLLEHPFNGQSENQPGDDFPKISCTPGLPASLSFSFSRKPLQNLFKGIRIGIDPGHGGKDTGYKGTVDLTEKHIALEIARELLQLLEMSRAIPVITRNDDTYLTDQDRFNILTAGNPRLCVQIHASGNKDPLAQTYSIAAKQDCEDSNRLGMNVATALLERMGIAIKAIAPLSGMFNLPFPLIKAEPLCLTYFADEANFRAPLFRKRLGQCIYNGIAKYLSEKPNEAI